MSQTVDIRELNELIASKSSFVNMITMGMDRVIITTIIITIMDRAITAIIMATEAAEEIIITRRSQRTGIQ